MQGVRRLSKVSVVNLSKGDLRLLLQEVRRVGKIQHFGKLLNVERKECTQVPLKESEWKSSGGTRPLKLSEGCADDFRAKKSSRREEKN